MPLETELGERCSEDEERGHEARSASGLWNLENAGNPFLKSIQKKCSSPDLLTLAPKKAQFKLLTSGIVR